METENADSGLRMSTFFLENNCMLGGAAGPSFSYRKENMLLLVPMRNLRGTLRHFLFRDVVLLWAKILQVPEEDARAVAQGTEDLRLP